MEWIGYSQASKLLVFLKAFCKQISTISQLSSGNNQGIPPRNLTTLLNKPWLPKLIDLKAMIAASGGRKARPYEKARPPNG